MRQILAIASIILLCTAAWANEEQKDLFRSPMWETMREIVLDEQDVVFDERVTVQAPTSAEDSTRVPVAVRVEGLQDVEEIIIFVDLNPFPQALHLHLDNAKPYVETRIRLNEASPIRAAAKTPDGVWHVGGTYVDAAGGGCTAPRSTQVGPGWEDHLNEVQARVWRRDDGADRPRVRVSHPMDTGLEDGIPAFFVEMLEVAAPDGRVLARLETFEPLAANPIFTLEVNPGAVGEAGYALAGRDNNGNGISAAIPPANKGHVTLPPVTGRPLAAN